MRRAPIVLVATAAGLVAVLSFHTAATPTVLGAGSSGAGSRSPASSSVPAGASSPPATGSGPAGGSGTSASGGSGSSSGTAGSSGGSGVPGSSSGATGTSASPGGSSPSSGATGASPGAGRAASGSATRTATGEEVEYFYGVVSVAVTASGHRITDVRIASLSDDGDFRSQSIDQYAVPLLEQQVLQAQSADIQGVSGATYTSEGFVKSLQSALSKLGI
jgi:uncharacterized protein with FMN-binding domain